MNLAKNIADTCTTRRRGFPIFQKQHKPIEEIKMKKYLALPLIAVFIASPAFAVETHHHVNSDTQKSGMMKGMMSHDQMTNMHEHMEKMQTLMKRIKSEKDPEKHHALLEEHIKAMKEGMHMMSGRMGMGDAKGAMKNMDAIQRIDMMEQRMSMMQMMMEQMIEHDMLKEDGVNHQHKR
jgi:hypothetical protein